MYQALHGLVHRDFNVFSIIVRDHSRITVIDFAQMVPTRHSDVEPLFDCDMDYVVYFRARTYGLFHKFMCVPLFDEVAGDTASGGIEVTVAARDFSIASGEDTPSAVAVHGRECNVHDTVQDIAMDTSQLAIDAKVDGIHSCTNDLDVIVECSNDSSS